jgi:radical SAM protein with 4Fe4S-binding SPASM domain
LKCRHCYQDAGKGLKNELNLEEKIATVHQLASMKIAYLAFSGGEPLLKDDFFLVAREASKMGIYTSVATNGTLLTKEMVNGIAEAGIKYIQISLDGAMPDSHDSLRGRIGCWKKTVQGIKNAVENGSFKVSLATTVTASNYPQFEKVLELAKKLRVDGLTIYNFVPTGRGKKMIKEDLNPEIREAMLKRAHQELSNGFDVLATAPQFSRVCIQSRRGKVGVAHFGKVESKMAEFVADILGGCGAGRVYCAIQPDGKVTPCVFIQLIAGDLRKEDFASIWRDSPLLNTLRSREDLKGWCGKCKFRSSCGGCRARALGYFNDLKGPDIGCILNRKWWEELRSVSS